MSTITLIPRFGRDYESADAVRADLEAGRDFVVADISSQWDTKPCNVHDLRAAGIGVARVRYSRLRKFTMIPVCAKPMPREEPGATVYIVPTVTEVGEQCRIVMIEEQVRNARDDYRARPQAWAEIGLMAFDGHIRCLSAPAPVAEMLRDCEPLAAGLQFLFTPHSLRSKEIV